MPQSFVITPVSQSTYEHTKIDDVFSIEYVTDADGKEIARLAGGVTTTDERLLDQFLREQTEGSIQAAVHLEIPLPVSRDAGFGDDGFQHRTFRQSAV